MAIPIGIEGNVGDAGQAEDQIEPARVGRPPVQQCADGSGKCTDLRNCAMAPLVAEPAHDGIGGNLRRYVRASAPSGTNGRSTGFIWARNSGRSEHSLVGPWWLLVSALRTPAGQ